MDDTRLALFLMLGQDASRTVQSAPQLAPPDRLLLSDQYDLATAIPGPVKAANEAALGYRLFYVFENFLRQLVVQVLTDDDGGDWWDDLPQDVRNEVEKLEDTEELKGWMALGSRDKSALMTYPQLLRTIDHCWKSHFAEIVRDKALLQEARHIAHLRNTICHMSPIDDEEIDRIRQVMRDWFRVVSP